MPTVFHDDNHQYTDGSVLSDKRGHIGSNEHIPRGIVNSTLVNAAVMHGSQFSGFEHLAQSLGCLPLLDEQFCAYPFRCISPNNWLERVKTTVMLSTTKDINSISVR